jgi:hypothetical protein
MKYVTVLLQIFAALPSLIKGVEQLFPEGTGKDKKEIVITMLAELFPDVPSVTSTIEKIIAYIVEKANANGTFKKVS